MTTLIFDMQTAFMFDIKDKAPEVLEKLGIKWAEAHPQPIFAQWKFCGCTNVPDVLPEYLTKQPAEQQKMTLQQAAQLINEVKEQPAPEAGTWYVAKEIDAMVRDLDVAMNGEGAAPEAKLCDLMPTLIKRLTEQPAQRMGGGMKSFDWQSNGERVEGAWYWVTDGSEVWPAVSRKSSVGGWGNDDTWEDFQKEVTAWQLIQKPAAPKV